MEKTRISRTKVSEDAIRNEFSKYIEGYSEQDKLFIIIENNEAISKLEYFHIKNKISEMSEIEYEKIFYMIPKTDYYVNIKMTTIAIIALIFDLKITAGFSSAIAGILGATGKSIIKLSKNQKCIVRYILEKKKKYFQFEEFLKEKNCKYNNLNCDIQREEFCGFNKEKLIEELENLVTNNVLEKEHAGYKLTF